MAGEESLSEAENTGNDASAKESAPARGPAEQARWEKRRARALALHGEARGLLSQGKPADAVVRLQKARGILLALGDEQELFYLLLSLGLAYSRRGKPADGWRGRVAMSRAMQLGSRLELPELEGLRLVLASTREGGF